MIPFAAAAALAAPAYVRTPDLHGDDVVFAAIGDLWVANVGTGLSRQLTTHPGDESAPYFSPDGRTVAFTAMYDGNADVYVIPVAGGEPTRLTWHPWRDEVVGWTPEGKVLLRTGANHPHGSAELFTVDPAGGDPVPVPIGFAARLDVEAATGRFAFDRIGYERRTWKRYRGGMAGDIWVGDPATQDFRPITSTEHGEGFPMWSGGRVYFLSDQGGTADLWSTNADGSAPARHTNGGDWDAKSPAMGDDGRIVFARAGDLWLFDPKTGKESLVSVDVEAERSPTRTRWPWAMGSLSWYTLAPEADRVMLVTRGEAFSVPVEDGPALPVTQGSGARESWASYSPDGKRVVYVTDEGGEESIVTADAWGRGDVRVVKAAGERGWHFPPLWSPDGKRIAWSDDTQTLSVAPAAGGEPKVVDRSEQAEIEQYVWSPDGRFLAYTKTDRRDYRQVMIWDSSTGEVHPVGTGMTDDHTPAWDPDGRWLWFVSERATNPLLGGRDFQVVEVRNSRLAMVLLDDDTDNPFAGDAGLPGVEAPVVEEKKKRRKKREQEEGTAPQGLPPVQIEWDGLASRTIVLEVERGTYGGLMATADTLYFLSQPTVGMVEDGGGSTLMSYSVEDEEVSTVLSGVRGYDLAPKAKKLLVSLADGMYVFEAGDGPPDLSEGRVDTAGVVVSVDPREEWRQIYFEAWRHQRDFYWDEGMGGVDWPKLRDQYATLLPRISTRAELQDLLGELIGELATSHTYVWGGDSPMKVDWVPTGLLGADLVREGDVYRVEHLYRGDPADELTNPLQVPGSVVEEGEYVLAVNHRPFRPGRPILAELEGKAGVPIVLTVGPSAKAGRDSRSVVVTPIWDESALRYADWVRQNREYVAEKSGGRFGYVHVPDMGTSGLVAFETWFYPQLDKEGLVVDVRWNGGGFVSQLLVERLSRELLSFDRARAGGVWTYPYRVLNGPFVVVTNEFAGSDGDIFPKAVQLAGLAPVVGIRSWGGVVGIRADKLLVDGGVLTQPEFASWYPDGGWLLENHGVDPDVVVQNLPQELAKGVDAQLDRAMAELLKLHAATPPIQPAFGPVPSKARAAFGVELPASPATPAGGN